jgi:Uma2 family endonuclease
MAVERKPNFISPEEFLAITRASPLRHEYIAGQMYEMASGSQRHSRVTGNVYHGLRNLLAASSCEPGTDLSVAAQASFLVPDVVVYCEGGSFKDDDILLNPLVIVEVLSPSTYIFDKGEKWMRYQRISSLMHYVLISQDQTLVEVFTHGPNTWEYSSHTSLADHIALTYIDCHLSLATIYERVDFEPRNDPATTTV